MTMAVNLREKNDRNPFQSPFRIPRDEIFGFEEKEKKTNFNQHRALSRVTIL